MSRISPQAKMIRAALTEHLRTCGVKERVQVRTHSHRVRGSDGLRYREWGHASTGVMRLPAALDLKALVADRSVTAYVVPAADPARRPLFWITSEYANGGRVVTVGGG